MSKSKGVYLLIFTIPFETEVEIGKLGRYSFLPGRYVYVGSGMGGVSARVRRHLCGCQSKRWHIDYLIENAVDKKAVIYLTDSREMECILSGLVRDIPGAENPVRGFGSSDCSCYSHLYLIPETSYHELLNIDLKNCCRSEVLTCRTIDQYEMAGLENH
ncbi:GIY-YIG nuclease family protein [Candidatus Methanomassiliicoccus intestinalis]|uniref:GIY-YIG nuclease family protein n=1 Tax=Candidatus Methanomassiliicoccus intestinalis TaxID=1406512 RepID=UPI0037DCACED